MDTQVDITKIWFDINKRDISVLTGGPKCKFEICISIKYDGFMIIMLMLMMIMLVMMMKMIILIYGWFSDPIEPFRKQNTLLWPHSTYGCNMST